MPTDTCSTCGRDLDPWGLLGAPVDTVVRDPDETPYCDRSDDPTAFFAASGRTT